MLETVCVSPSTQAIRTFFDAKMAISEKSQPTHRSKPLQNQALF